MLLCALAGLRTLCPLSTVQNFLLLFGTLLHAKLLARWLRVDLKELWLVNHEHTPTEATLFFRKIGAIRISWASGGKY